MTITVAYFGAHILLRLRRIFPMVWCTWPIVALFTVILPPEISFWTRISLQKSATLVCHLVVLVHHSLNCVGMARHLYVSDVRLPIVVRSRTVTFVHSITSSKLRTRQDGRCRFGGWRPSRSQTDCGTCALIPGCSASRYGVRLMTFTDIFLFFIIYLMAFVLIL